MTRLLHSKVTDVTRGRGSGLGAWDWELGTRDSGLESRDSEAVQAKGILVIRDFRRVPGGAIVQTRLRKHSRRDVTRRPTRSASSKSCAALSSGMYPSSRAVHSCVSNSARDP